MHDPHLPVPLADEATLHAAMLLEAERVLGLLRAAAARVVTAESCTGGWWHPPSPIFPVLPT